MLSPNANVIKILALLVFSSVAAVLWTPLLTNFLYKNKLWRKKAREKSIDGKPLEVFTKFHQKKEVGTPRLGGLLIWLTALFTAFFFFFLSRLFDGPVLGKLDFLSRDQTWLPLAVLVAASLLGFFDDIFQIFGKGKYTAGGIKFTRRLMIVILIGIVAAFWFYFKLGWNTIHIPGIGDMAIGLWYLPLFVLVMLASWAGGAID